ncbi:hypothetical protein GF339_10385 [candidate division KSB3 bacterium]|uniref:Zinc-ribbon domain-containing protein n=1 Tax=candidate division KSB3 bacterium TaxID=2044937 RepID=A0A9D5JW21_9BACT|nr:hypothetical protein [candidate division KSB3 bacterium]MBD3324982.1 hypothetical protein [candidate division KSB3 bacterium]
MKDNTPDGKKPRRPGHESEADQPEQRNFPGDEDDVDFEILDALEHMEQQEEDDQESIVSEDDTIELTLDEDDIILGDEEEDAESGFRFDERVTADLEEELGESLSGFTLDDSPEEESEDFEPGTEEDEAFSLDLDQDEDQDEMDLAFGDQDDDMAEFDLDLDEDDFSLGAEDEEADAEQFAVEIEQEAAEETFAVPDEFGQPQEPTATELGGSEDDFGELDLDEDLSDVDIEQEADVLSSPESSNGTFGSASEEFYGKSVIAVEDDQVIDLGTEADLEEEKGFAGDIGVGEDEVDTEDVEGDEVTTDDDTVLDLEAEDEEADAEEDVMASFDEIDLNLEEEEPAEIPEALEQEEDLPLSATDDMGAMEASVNIDLTESQAEEEASQIDTSDLDIPEEDGPDDLSSIEPPQLEAEPAEFPPEEAPSADMLAEAEGAAAPEASEESPETEPELDDREFLGLTLRLSEDQMQAFEGMIIDAETLQSYLEKLDRHKDDIKANVYQRLHDEYTSRKQEIFSAAEFTTIHADVKADLDDLLVKQTEFAATVDRLNEELEEITVRHLVGEYTDDMLHDKEAAQQAEIAHWNEKTERIGHIIQRYQHALDAEQELNPLRQEPEDIPQPPVEEPPEAAAEGSALAEPVEAATDEAALLESEAAIEQEEAFEEEEVDFDALARVAEQFAGDEELPEADYAEEEAEEEATIACKKCGRQTPDSEKFCIHCGAKPR